jgi:hypothetical protein
MVRCFSVSLERQWDKVEGLLSRPLTEHLGYVRSDRMMGATAWSVERSGTRVVVAGRICPGCYTDSSCLRQGGVSTPTVNNERCLIKLCMCDFLLLAKKGQIL